MKSALILADLGIFQYTLTPYYKMCTEETLSIAILS